MKRPSSFIPCALLCALWLIATLAPATANAQTLRYFGVWSYTENTPREELAAADLPERKLGYWEVEFDPDGKVTSATYRGVGGVRWLSFEYVEVEDRIYADLYGADGVFLRRKSTSLTTREPRAPVDSTTTP